MALGFLLQGVVLAYAAAVGLEGGFFNEEIPADLNTHRENYIKDVASQQSLETLAQEAIERAMKDQPVPIRERIKDMVTQSSWNLPIFEEEQEEEFAAPEFLLDDEFED